MMKKLVRQAMRPKKDFSLTHTKLFNPTNGRFMWMKNYNASVYLMQPNTPWQLAIGPEGGGGDDADSDDSTTVLMDV